MVARLTQLEMTKRDGVNGEAIFILYAHLEEYSITSGSVSAGVKIGKAGRTGNLESVIDKGTAVQHIHIEVKKGVSWSSGTYKNPENYTTTKFNDKGEADEKTSC